MNSHIDEEFSAAIDGELEHSELNDTVSKICKDGELKDCWQRYHLIRDALQSNLPNKINFKFSQSVMAAIESEPTVLTPSSISNEQSVFDKRLFKKQLTPVMKRVAGLAIAASVAAIAVIGVQSTQGPAFQSENNQQLATMPSDSEFSRLPSADVTSVGATMADVTIADVTITNVTPASTATMQVLSSFPNSKIPSATLAANHQSFPNLQKYVVDHNQRVLSSPIQGVMPYARIVILRSPTRSLVER